MSDDADLDEPMIEFFRKGNIKAVQRVLERARKKVEATRRKQAGAGKVSKKKSLLGKAINQAMSAYGRANKNAPSIRKVAPDTGGRPYHFSYSTVSKNGGRGRSADDADEGGSRGTGGAGESGPAGETAKAAGKRKGKGNRANTAEAAHQIYTERDGAVDHEAPALDAALETERAAALGRDLPP